MRLATFLLALAIFLAFSPSEGIPNVTSFGQDFSIIAVGHPDWPAGEIEEHSSCHHFARNIVEPYTDRYYRRSSFSLPYPWDVVPRSYWRWDGPKFSREAFLAAIADKPRCRCGKGCCACSGCDQAMHYKIIGGRLWKQELCDACGNRVHTAEEIVKVALHLFPIPDMEFALHFGDGCMYDAPVINYCFCRNATGGGFTMPSYGLWMSSMGPTQMTVYHTCLNERYPPTGRKPLAVWRGSSTNPEVVTEENYLQAPRLKVHMLSREHPDLLDTKITVTTVRVAPQVRALFNDTVPKMPTEDYNRYCAVLHFDGNGWSDRFAQYLIHYPTPILRIASNITAFFDHVFAPGETFEPFAPDMSDLLDRVRRVVRECERQGEKSAMWKRTIKLQTMARLYMDHVGVAEAMAYTLHVYRNHSDFEMDYGLEGFTELNMTCCKYTNIPPELTAAMVERWNRLRSANPPGGYGGGNSSSGFGGGAAGSSVGGGLDGGASGGGAAGGGGSAAGPLPAAAEAPAVTPAARVGPKRQQQQAGRATGPLAAGPPGGEGAESAAELPIDAGADADADASTGQLPHDKTAPAGGVDGAGGPAGEQPGRGTRTGRAVGRPRGAARPPPPPSLLSIEAYLQGSASERQRMSQPDVGLLPGAGRVASPQASGAVAQGGQAGGLKPQGAQAGGTAPEGAAGQAGGVTGAAAAQQVAEAGTDGHPLPEQMILTAAGKLIR